MGLMTACAEFFIFLRSFFEVLPNAVQFLITGCFGIVLVISVLKMMH